MFFFININYFLRHFKPTITREVNNNTFALYTNYNFYILNALTVVCNIPLLNHKSNQSNSSFTYQKIYSIPIRGKLLVLHIKKLTEQ